MKRNTVRSSSSDSDNESNNASAPSSVKDKVVRESKKQRAKSSHINRAMRIGIFCLSVLWLACLLAMFVSIQREDTQTIGSHIHAVLNHSHFNSNWKEQHRLNNLRTVLNPATATAPDPKNAATKFGSKSDEYHNRADQAALAKVRHPIKITSTPSTTSVAANQFIDMRDLTATLPFDNPDGGAWKQGWDVGPKPLDPNNPLKVFIVPHSHCDPGWIKTFDVYFRSQTKGILDTIYNALKKDKRRKFIWAEISYFEWWWREQPKHVQETMTQIINDGQLEFVTGGWVQPDEANTQRYAIEIQLQEGHDWLRQTFGDHVIPKFAWSIDPFGYSPTMADILKDYGFQGMLIQRVHYAVKKELAQRKHLEFNWRQTYDDTGDHDIFTHVMPFYSYDVPHTCGPDPSVCCQFDFARINNGYGGCPWHKPAERITHANVARRSKLILDQWQKKASLYRSNVVLVPLGDDFRYRTNNEAEEQYNNFQMIFDYLNANVKGVQVQFGTLSDYFNAVRGTFQPPLLKGSFFTYADRDQDYWSGYFTSRVFDKALDRKLEQVLFAASAMGATPEEMREHRRSLSLFQHHDGVTGTAKDIVVEDYARYMHNAIENVQKWMVDKLKTNLNTSSLQPCWKASAPRSLGYFDCKLSQPAIVFNPLPIQQSCGDMIVPSHSAIQATLPCENAGPLKSDTTASSIIKFDPITGMMIEPFKEEWMVWKVRKGGAYLFFPSDQVKYLDHRKEKVTIQQNGFIVSTSKWERTIIQKKVPNEFGTGSATVLDFIFKTKLEIDNEEWFVRFNAPISNKGVFHTDLNGANFDTHHFRSDLPIQSQVFPMPTLASIEDSNQRLTVLSEHAQGTASLKDGTIDVWLDRRLLRDDERGLGQGVRDNVLTKTRFRLLLETENYDSDPSTEFEITQLCKAMWDELNHPLEIFGGVGNPTSLMGGLIETTEKMLHLDNNEKNKGSSEGNTNAVPFVFMVHDRVDYFKVAIESLRNSDFPKKLPLIISHDGHVPEMMEYVKSLKSEFNVIQIFHPHACYDHPHEFPADAPELNEGYEGDIYHNKRSPWATCAKHHWIWMTKTVFDMDFDIEESVESIFFIEEDYVVSPTIYSTIMQGLSLAVNDSKYFGIIFDRTNSGTDKAKVPHVRAGEQDWHEMYFKTGPFAIGRKTWQKVINARDVFCERDEYNWDWTLVYLMSQEVKEDLRLPYLVLVPSVIQVTHIGTEGMHGSKIGNSWSIPKPFHGTDVIHSVSHSPTKFKANGGFHHPKDIEHCKSILAPKWQLFA
mmetsp:Transcript_83/g.95  ORF Transcript_83/g.95 Transcript_83/m.95 type:complete len:1276 (+) Transcript_83:55-3882(+)